MVPRLKEAPDLTVTPVSQMPPQSNISVVVPLPSWNYNPLKPFDESYFERAVDTILSEEAELEAPQEMDMMPEEEMERALQAEMNNAPEEELYQAPEKELDHASEEELDQSPEDEMDQAPEGEIKILDICGPFGYDGTPLSTQIASHESPKSHQSQKSQPKAPSSLTSSTSHPRLVLAPDYENPSIFASVGGEKRLEVLKAIAKMPFMLKQPLRRSEQLILIKDIRDCATNAGLEEENVDALLDYVRRVYFDTHQSFVTVNNTFVSGDEVNDLVEAPTERSIRKRRNSVFNVDEVDVHNEPKRRKKIERSSSKTQLRSRKGSQRDDSTVIMTGLESENEPEARVFGSVQVDEPHADGYEADEPQPDELQADGSEADGLQVDAFQPDELQASEFEVDEADELQADESAADEAEAGELEAEEFLPVEPQLDECQVDESPQDTGLSPRGRSFNTAQANPEKSADTIEVVDLSESEHNNGSHNRRNASPSRFSEINHPVKTSSKKQSKKSEKRHLKANRHSRKALPSDSTATINGLETQKDTKARENSYIRVNPHGPAVLSSRKKSSHTQLHSPAVLSSRKRSTVAESHDRDVFTSRRKSTHTQPHGPAVLSSRKKSTNTTRENSHPQPKPHGHSVVSSRRKSTNTPQASSGKSSHLIDPIEPASNDVSHSRRSTSPQYPRENGHPVKTSKTRKSSHAKSQNGPENDPNQTQKDKEKGKRSRRAEGKRRASMSGLKQLQGTVDAFDTAQEPILPSIPDESLTRRAKKRRRSSMGELKPPVKPIDDDTQKPILPSIPKQDLIRRAGEKRKGSMENLTQVIDAVAQDPILPSTPKQKPTRPAGKNRGGSMDRLKQPEDAVDAVAQELILTSMPKPNLTRPADGKRQVITVDPVAQGPIMPSTPRRMVTESPKRHSPFPPLPADPTKWDLDFF
jgi:hypothetical protein